MLSRSHAHDHRGACLRGLRLNGADVFGTHPYCVSLNRIYGDVILELGSRRWTALDVDAASNRVALSAWTLCWT